MIPSWERKAILHSANPSSPPPRSVSSAVASAASPKRDQSCVETSSGRPSASSSLMTRADAADWRCRTSHNRFTRRAARWDPRRRSLGRPAWEGNNPAAHDPHLQVLGLEQLLDRPAKRGEGREREQARRARERDRTTIITATHAYNGSRVRGTLHTPPPRTRPADVRARWPTTHVRDGRTDARAIRFDGPLPVRTSRSHKLTTGKGEEGKSLPDRAEPRTTTTTTYAAVTTRADQVCHVMACVI